MPRYTTKGPSDFDTTPPEDSPFFAVIGRFIVEYARAEAYVHLLARRMLGVYTPRANIIFHGMRLGDLADRIRGMMRVDGLNHVHSNDIDACLTQLDLIGKERQRIAHRFVEIGNGVITTHNAYTAKHRKNVEYHEFQPAELEDMISDCYRIRQRIVRYTDREARRRDKQREWMDWLFQPWLYRPPPPKTQKKPRRKAPES